MTRPIAARRAVHLAPPVDDPVARRSTASTVAIRSRCHVGGLQASALRGLAIGKGVGRFVVAATITARFLKLVCDGPA